VKRLNLHGNSDLLHSMLDSAIYVRQPQPFQCPYSRLQSEAAFNTPFGQYARIGDKNHPSVAGDRGSANPTQSRKRRSQRADKNLLLARDAIAAKSN
jgi:hypothetical protein